MSKPILAISGNDIFSGGGLHADLTTYAREQLYGFVAVTCLTRMTDKGFDVVPIDAGIVADQLASLKDVDFAAIKIGLLPTVRGHRSSSLHADHHRKKYHFLRLLKSVYS